MRFFLHIRKFYCTFAPVISPRLGLCLSGGVVADIIKASNTLCAWLSGISQILTTSNTLQHFDVLGICISISVHLKIDRCACAYISAWASVLLVRMLRQCESLRQRNSNSAVPLFLCVKKRNTVSRPLLFCVICGSKISILKN